MIALVVADTILVLLLALLVAGLLRSHADIVRTLHEMGAPIGDPSVSPASAPLSVGKLSASSGVRRSPEGMLQVGPVMPPRPAASAVFDLEGLTPSGDALGVAVSGVERHTLLAFLSSGCSSCGQFWEELGQTPSALPFEVRPVIVTKGAEAEVPASVENLSGPPGVVSVIMSTKAWRDYEVPGSPFFVLIDGPAARRAGEGSARNLAEVAELVRVASSERPPRRSLGSNRQASHVRPDRDDVTTTDEELRAAGLLPGDPSLFPRSVDDVLVPVRFEDSNKADR
ncbi:MAG: hypothetical protein ACYCSF_00600 [Acidimicrobiales bacterium]